MHNLTKIYYPANPHDPRYSKDFADMLYESYVQPLSKLGYTLKGSLSESDDNDGFHILKFQHDGVTGYRYAWLAQITDCEEEGMASRSINYFGTLIVTIVFTC